MMKAAQQGGGGGGGSTVAFWPVEPRYRGGHPLNRVNQEVSCKEVSRDGVSRISWRKCYYLDRFLSNANVEESF